MIVQKYKDMLSGKSVIRQLSEFATARGAEIGYENVFDYSLGNPSVPVPQEFTDKMIQMLQTESSNTLHGYSPSLGITKVREAIAASLKKRFGIPYTANHIFMASGAAGALAHAINVIGHHGYSMRSIKSRAMKDLIWTYYFYVEITGDLQSRRGKYMLDELSDCCDRLRMIGTFKDNCKI